MNVGYELSSEYLTTSSLILHQGKIFEVCSYDDRGNISMFPLLTIKHLPLGLLINGPSDMSKQYKMSSLIDAGAVFIHELENLPLRSKVYNRMDDGQFGYWKVTKYEDNNIFVYLKNGDNRIKVDVDGISDVLSDRFYRTYYRAHRLINRAWNNSHARSHLDGNRGNYGY